MATAVSPLMPSGTTPAIGFVSWLRAIAQISSPKRLTRGLGKAASDERIQVQTGVHKPPCLGQFGPHQSDCDAPPYLLARFCQGLNLGFPAALLHRDLYRRQWDCAVL
jgi:hypothetical protein